jgi:hypothetical protein
MEEAVRDERGNSGGAFSRNVFDQFDWMADITIPYREPDRALFFWGEDGVTNAQLENWPVTVALSACRFLAHFLSITSYYGTKGLVNATRDELVTKFGLDPEDAWDRCNASWQLVCYGLRDFHGALSGLLTARDDESPKIFVLVSPMHYWSIHEATRWFPLAFPDLEEEYFCQLDEGLGFAKEFLDALDWDHRSLRALDGTLSPYLNLWPLSEVAAQYEAKAAR